MNCDQEGKFLNNYFVLQEESKKKNSMVLKFNY